VSLSQSLESLSRVIAISMLRIENIDCAIRRFCNSRVRICDVRNECMNYRSSGTPSGCLGFSLRCGFWDGQWRRRGDRAMKTKCESLLSSSSRDRLLVVSFFIAHVAMKNSLETIHRRLHAVSFGESVKPATRTIILDEFALHSRVIVLLPQ